MTKMEHYKKRLLQQHEKPAAMLSLQPTAEEEGDSTSQSPTIPTQNSNKEKKKDDVQSKVTRKRGACRSKFRHQNLEFFKLGNSIPTSLCKTKEPYNVCTEKNLQLCYQNQNSKKCEEPVNKDITDSILHSMEGNKRKDILWRSVSLNDTSETLNKPSNIIENNNSGRHILPAIVPEIPDRRKSKIANPRESKTSIGEKDEKVRVDSNLVIRKADPVSINKRKAVVKRRKTVIGIENSESEVQSVEEEPVSDYSNIPNRETNLLLRRKSVSTESEISNSSPINLSLKNNIEGAPHIQVNLDSAYNDPRGQHLNPRQYLKQSLPKEHNTLNKLPVSSLLSHELEQIADQSTSPATSTESHEPAKNYMPTNPTTLTYQDNESARNSISDASGLSASSIQNHEPTRNYVAGPSKSSVLPPQNHILAGPNKPLLQNHDLRINYVPNTHGRLPQNPEPARNYFVGPSTSSTPLPYYPNNYIGLNFPEIHQQMSRLENPNASLQQQNIAGMPRKEKRILPDPYLYQPVNPPMANNEEVIKTIIQLVKSSMDPNFSIEILMILNKWYIELKSYTMQPKIGKRLKTSIMKTLNDIILYISEKLFGVSCNLQLRSYVEQIFQFVAPHHKDLLVSLLPLLRRNYSNDQWMSSFIKLLSHSQQIPPPDPQNQANSHHTQPVVDNHPNPMYSVPVTRHSYPPASITPQNYYPHNPPQLPYQGFPYPPNSPMPGNYMPNLEQHHRNGMLPPYPGNHLEAAGQLRRDERNMEHSWNIQRNLLRFENSTIPVSTMVTPEMYLANNRRVPPEFEPNPTPEQQAISYFLEQNRIATRNKERNKDRLDIIPIIPTTTSTSMAVPNIVLQRTTDTNRENKDIGQTSDIGIASKKQTTDIDGNKSVSQQNSETSPSSSKVAEHPVPDVEELLQTNFIFNKSRSGNVDKSSSISVTNDDKKTNENVTISIKNAESQLGQEATNNNHDNSNQNSNLVSSTVIVEDKSMEITRGNSNENLYCQESMVDKNREGFKNDTVLEKVDLSNETEDVTPTSTSIDNGNAVSDSPDSKEELRSTFYQFSHEIKAAYESCKDATPEELKEILHKNFDKNFKKKFEKVFQILSGPIQEEKIEVKYLATDEIIMIDDDEDISIEKVAEMPKPKDALPRLIRLLPAKRKEVEPDKNHQEKKLRTGSASAPSSNDEIVIIDDEEKDDNTTIAKIEEDMANNSDCNQNYITTVDQNITTNDVMIEDKVKDETNPVNTEGNIPSNETSSTWNIPVTDSPVINEKPLPTVLPETPAIEDISSDEEKEDKFSHHCCFESEIGDDTLSTLGNLEVSKCSLLNGNVGYIESASNREFFEKPLVYTRPVTPRNVRRRSRNSTTMTSVPRSSKEIENECKLRERNCLANIIQFEEDSTSSTSVVNVQSTWDRNYSNPKNTKEREILLKSTYQVSMEGASPLVSPAFPVDNRYPGVSPLSSPTSRYSLNFNTPNRSVSVSPVASSPSSVSTATLIVPLSPLVPATSSVVPAITSLVSAMPMLTSSRVNWQNWFAEEKQKGFFNLERPQSVESGRLSRRQSVETVCSGGSDYCPTIPAKDQYCEIKIDSKVYRIKDSIYKRIPKGKLCYIRESNTLIRYFDDSQMELFIHNLNISEGSSIASDLLKQIKGRVEGISDIETSLDHYEDSEKSEVIKISKDMTFSTEDYLAEPELYVEEVVKVQRCVPKDFYGFYKYVTGYQIVNHHPPISFQTFLTMHNTNGIRRLLKNYVNTLIEGHTIS